MFEKLCIFDFLANHILLQWIINWGFASKRNPKKLNISLWSPFIFTSKPKIYLYRVIQKFIMHRISDMMTKKYKIKVEQFVKHPHAFPLEVDVPDLVRWNWWLFEPMISLFLQFCRNTLKYQISLCMLKSLFNVNLNLFKE